MLEKGYLPASQHPTRSKMCNDKLNDPQMAGPSLQPQSNVGSCSLVPGELRQHLNGAVNVECSNLNIANQEELMDPSLEQQKQVRYEYPPATLPRAPDK
jgi:hypothetical protein